MYPGCAFLHSGVHSSELVYAQRTVTIDRMHKDTLSSIVSRLNNSAHALAAVAAAIDARLSGESIEPPLQAHVHEIVEALGASAALAAASELELRALLGEIRTYSLTHAKLLFAASRRAGWRHGEPELLAAAGDVSSIVAHRIHSVIAPQLDGLAARLDAPDAMFLDVGVGVACLSVEMALLWPRLRVVGIDPHAIALTLARERVRAAGLERRVELREQSAEELCEQQRYDLAWLPSLFLPEASVPAIVERVVRALRPGGWLLFPCMRADGDGLERALARLRTALFGGYMGGVVQVERLLAAHGLTSVRALAGPATALTSMVVGRRRG